MDLKENLRYLREQKGLSQQEVADLIHINRCTLANYEAGRREPQSKILSKLADLYNVSLKELIENEKEDEKVIDTLIFKTVKMLRSENFSKEQKDQTMKKIMDLWINDQRERAIAL